MNIVIIGSGYVGTTAAAIFAMSGHNVIALDVDPKKVDSINSGKAPFFETGLDNLLNEAVERKTLSATLDYSIIETADFVFSCVGTPDNPDGSSNLQYVFQSAEQAAKYLKNGAIFIQKSTVPVGTGKAVSKLLPKSVEYVSNPEFLRESTAIYDTIFFDRVVAGGINEEANHKILDLHRTVEKHSREIADISGISYDIDTLASHSGEYISTGLESAELIKVTSNAFLSLKISFANSIAKLSDQAGADVDEVMSVVGGDARIGRAFFNAGRGYGGGCFPKDVSGLITSAQDFGVEMPIMTASQAINESMPGYIVNKAIEAYGKDIKDVKVAVLGLAFKAGTSDARKSPAVKMANYLVNEGAVVSAYDPEGSEEAKADLKSSIKIASTMNKALEDAEIIFIATDWREFTSITDWAEITPTATILVDAMNCISKQSLGSSNIRYVGVGR